MPDLAGPFDGSTFAQSQWFRDRGVMEPSGVIGQPPGAASGGELGLTVAGFGLSVALGRAHVRGAAYERTGTAWTDTVPANTSSAGPRNDLVVLRRDLTAKTVVPLRLQGTAAATPTDPAVTQVDTGTWDLPLYRVQAPPSSGTPLVVTDLRTWIDPALGAILPSYQYPLLLNTWKNYDATGYERCRYYVNASGELRVVGLLANASGLVNGQTTTVFNIAAGYRPPRQTLRMGLLGNTSLQRVDVTNLGDVIVTANGAYGANTTTLALDLTVPLFE